MILCAFGPNVRGCRVCAFLHLRCEFAGKPIDVSIFFRAQFFMEQNQTVSKPVRVCPGRVGARHRVCIFVGENYADVVQQASEGGSRIYLIFFMGLTIFGLFFIMAMVAGFFESGKCLRRV